MYATTQSLRIGQENNTLPNFLSCYVLWKHNTRPIHFTSVVDNFGVKYTQQEDADHLKTVLERDYIVTADWTGKRYIGITLDWDYEQQ